MSPFRDFSCSFRISPLNGVDDQFIEAANYRAYLLALAYELSGDEAQAVQIYWQLWYDSPGSPYALLARAKLAAKR